MGALALRRVQPAAEVAEAQRQMFAGELAAAEQERRAAAEVRAQSEPVGVAAAAAEPAGVQARAAALQPVEMIAAVAGLPALAAELPPVLARAVERRLQGRSGRRSREDLTAFEPADSGDSRGPSFTLSGCVVFRARTHSLRKSISRFQTSEINFPNFTNWARFVYNPPNDRHCQRKDVLFRGSEAVFPQQAEHKDRLQLGDVRQNDSGEMRKRDRRRQARMDRDAHRPPDIRAGVHPLRHLNDQGAQEGDCPRQEVQLQIEETMPRDCNSLIDSLPPEIARSFGLTWHFVGEISRNNSSPGVDAACTAKCLPTPVMGYSADAPADLLRPIPIVRLKANHFIRSDGLRVIVYFGICDNCGSIYWARQVY